MATKTQTLNWFRSQLGYKEARGNRTKYARLAGHANGYAWCATFQVAGFRAVGMRLGNESGYCPSLLDSLIAHKISGPQVGALAFLYFPSEGRVAHVGIVESVRKDGRFVTIEGNTDVKGGRTGGQVMRKVRARTGFTFVMPVYSAAPAPKKKPGASKPAPPSPALLQRALHTTADGAWGPTTDKFADALRMASGYHGGKFPYGVQFAQRVVGAKMDGDWGPSSIKAHHATTKEVQKALTAMGFKADADGSWGPGTEEAYRNARARFRR